MPITFFLTLAPVARTACNSSRMPYRLTPTQPRPRHRIVVLIVIVTAAVTMLGAGYEVSTVVGAVVAVGLAAAEICARLLGPAPLDSAPTASC